MKIVDSNAVAKEVPTVLAMAGGPSPIASGNSLTLVANGPTTASTISASPFSPTLPLAGQTATTRAVQYYQSSLSAYTIQLPSVTDVYVTECRLYLQNTSGASQTVTISGGKGGPYTIPSGQYLELILRPTGSATLGYWTTAGQAFS